MSEKRKVLIGFPGGTQPKHLETTATTWGALKGEIETQFGETFENQKVREFYTSHHYSDGAALLPTVAEIIALDPANVAGDLKLLVSTDKNKSGMPTTKANYHKVGFTDLRTFCKKMTGFAPNGKQACVDALDKHYGKSSPAPKASVKAKASVPAKKKAEIPQGGKIPKPASLKLEDRIAKLETQMKEVLKDLGDPFMSAVRENN